MIAITLLRRKYFLIENWSNCKKNILKARKGTKLPKRPCKGHAKAKNNHYNYHVILTYDIYWHILVEKIVIQN